MKHETGIKGKLLVSLLVFTAVIIFVLWLLQVVFLNDIYKSIKINTINAASQRISQISEKDLPSYVMRLADRQDICVAVYDDSLNLIAGEHAGGQCVVHRISQDTVKLFYAATLESENQMFQSYLPAEEIESVIKKSNFFTWFFFDRNNASFGDDWHAGVTDNEVSYDCVLLSRVAQDADGNQIYILLSTAIIPVDSTVETIRFELNLIIGLLLIMSLIMAYVLSRWISRPLIRLSRASKSLPAGHFDSNGIGGYREVRELSDTLEYAAKEISKVDSLRKELIANVSHDLRTPLTLISGYSEVMRDLPGENTPENLQVIIDEAQRLSNLVNDMLDLSKLEAGMDVLNEEEIDFTELVRTIMHRYEKLMDKDGYKIRFEKESEHVLIRGDNLKLSQVIYNLVNNAVHYCGEDKTVIVRQIVQENTVRLEVIDHGEGIPKEKLNDIWERYYRIDKNHTTSTIGSGLGLSIVKKVLQLHSARFGVESELGKGSCFWFELPLA